MWKMPNRRGGSTKTRAQSQHQRTSWRGTWSSSNSGWQGCDWKQSRWRYSSWDYSYEDDSSKPAPGGDLWSNGTPSHCIDDEGGKGSAEGARASPPQASTPPTAQPSSSTYSVPLKDLHISGYTFFLLCRRKGLEDLQRNEAALIKVLASAREIDTENPTDRSKRMLSYLEEEVDKSQNEQREYHAETVRQLAMWWTRRL